MCFQAVLHGRILLISQHSELSCLLGTQVPESIHHLPILLLSSFLWSRPSSSSMEMPQFYQQNSEQREQCPSVEQELSCGEEEEEGKENEEELLGL